MLILAQSDSEDSDAEIAKAEELSLDDIGKTGFGFISLNSDRRQRSAKNANANTANSRQKV